MIQSVEGVNCVLKFQEWQASGICKVKVLKCYFLNEIPCKWPSMNILIFAKFYIVNLANIQKFLVGKNIKFPSDI